MEDATTLPVVEGETMTDKMVRELHKSQGMLPGHLLSYLVEQGDILGCCQRSTESRVVQQAPDLSPSSLDMD